MALASRGERARLRELRVADCNSAGSSGGGSRNQNSLSLLMPLKSAAGTWWDPERERCAGGRVFLGGCFVPIERRSELVVNVSRKEKREGLAGLTIPACRCPEITAVPGSRGVV